jgi:hypothetical protein
MYADGAPLVKEILGRNRLGEALAQEMKSVASGVTVAVWSSPDSLLRGFGDFVGLGGLVLEEAEGGVALAEDAGLQEAADALGQIESAAMLGDYEAALAEKWGGAEEAEDAVVLRFFGVGRVEEDEIEWGVGRFVLVGDFLEGAEGVEGEDLRAGSDCEGCEVATDQASGGGVVFDEDDFEGAAAEGFDANGAGAGEDIEETRAGDVGAEDVEEGFAEAVAGGTERVALEGFEDAAAIFAGDDAHIKTAASE